MQFFSVYLQKKDDVKHNSSPKGDFFKACGLQKIVWTSKKRVPNGYPVHLRFSFDLGLGI